jgi:hypothetical protein
LRVSLFTSLVSVAPSRKRVKTSGLRLGKTASNRSPKASRLNPVAGESAAAPSSRQKPGFSPPPSSSRLAIRKAASPMRAPPIPVLMWSFREGGVTSPAVSQTKLPPRL